MEGALHERATEVRRGGARGRERKRERERKKGRKDRNGGAFSLLRFLTPFSLCFFLFLSFFLSLNQPTHRFWSGGLLFLAFGVVPRIKNRRSEWERIISEAKGESFFFLRSSCLFLSLSLSSSHPLFLYLFENPLPQPNAPSSSSTTSPTSTASPSSASCSPAAPPRNRSPRCPSSGCGPARCSFCSSSGAPEARARKAVVLLLRRRLLLLFLLRARVRR